MPTKKQAASDFDKSPEFTAALLSIQQREGRGFQTTLAKNSGVLSSYINEIMKGKRAGAEHVRRALAAAIGEPYEKLIALGRWILDGNIPERFVYSPGNHQTAYEQVLADVAALREEVEELRSMVVNK